MDVNSEIARISQELRLEATATTDAVAGSPARNDTSLTGTETQCIAEAKKTAQNELETIRQHEENTEKGTQECEKTLSEIRQNRQSGIPTPAADDLAIPKRARDNAIASYNLFKAEHKLQRDATNPNAFLNFVLVIAVMAAEGVLNSYFFAKGSELYYLGGFFRAFTVSMINVGFAFIGGAFCLRYLNHRDMEKKLAGFLFLLICLAACIAIVTLSALYRGHLDALSRGEIDPVSLSTQAWQLAVTDLGKGNIAALFASFDSFLLILIGTLCGIIGMWKGYRIADPYPGFGEMGRHKDAAIELYNESKTENDEKVTGWKLGRIKILQNLAEKLDAVMNEMNTHFAGLRFVINAANELPTKTGQLAQGLLAVYREKNKQIRADDAPAYFDQYPDEGEFSMLGDEWQGRKNKFQTLENEVERLRTACQKEASKIQEEIAILRSGQ